ncbi:MAG: ABC transporter permease, partial [Treponema sp.]|nr:ABC transporter permease [Treponema sp.]
MLSKIMLSDENIPDIPKEKFEFVQKDARLTDIKLQTKPTGYFKDAMTRFVKNKGSVICFCIIVAIILFAIFGPVFSPYEVSTRDGYYAYTTPRNGLFASMGFWDGSKTEDANIQRYQYLKNLELETGAKVIMKDYGTVEHNIAGRKQTWYKVKIDTYEKVGFVKVLLTKDEYEAARAYEASSGKKLFYPALDSSKIKNSAYKSDQNAWYETDAKGVMVGKTPKNIFVKDSSSPDGYAYYVTRMNGEQYETRVLYKEWYYYKNGRYASFLFGADMSGYDIFTRLGNGARLSLILAFFVSAINIFLGIVIGAIEGYYGGNVDLYVERIKDILIEVPTLVIFALFQLYLATKVGPVPSMFFAFVFYGWINTSSTVRAQFYRFKGQDYINASRTLGAKDSRLIFRHILPNAIGFIITKSILTIPSVIFSEANMT